MERSTTLNLQVMNNVESLKGQINALKAKVFAVENGIKTENSVLLVQETLNLLEGVEVTEGDYYAESRYYSRIEGVKNIRFYRGLLTVKVESPKGELLPKAIVVEGEVYTVHTYKSRYYKECLDY